MNKKSNLYNFLLLIVSTFLWLMIWEISALIINKTFIFPGAILTLKTLFDFILMIDFWKTVSISILRIFSGLILGIIAAVASAVLCRLVPITKSFVTIGMTVIKSTPVAAVIMIMWLFINSELLPVFISMLMVCPVNWQNLMDGFSAIDKDLDEVTVIFNFSKNKRLKYLVLPTLLKFFIPAVLTSIGLAWKSGIASEIISYAKLSIGKYIYDAKWTFEGAELLAWTLTVVLISLFFELTVKMLVRRLTAKYGY